MPTSSDELGDLFAAATPLLNKIDTTNLSTVLGELAQASQGEGPKIAASISAGTQLAGLLDRTLNAQILALQSFAKFTQAIAPAAGDLNNLNAQINAALPSFNAEEADYENLLNTLIPFSNRLAALLSTYHPDIATILESGDNVSRVLLAQQDSLGQVINGAYHYFQKIAEGASGRSKLPDGSTYAYFNTFILFSDVNSLVCNLIAPPTGGMSFLQPIQQALAGAGSAFNCSSELATFNALQSSSTPAAPRTRRAADRPRPRRAPAAPPLPRPTRPTASSASPTSPRRPTSAASSPSSSGGCREIAAALPEVGVQVLRVRAGLPGPSRRAGRQDRKHLAVQQPPHHQRAVERRDGAGQWRQRQHRRRARGPGLEHRRAAWARAHLLEHQQHGVPALARRTWGCGGTT